MPSIVRVRRARSGIAHRGFRDVPRALSTLYSLPYNRRHPVGALARWFEWRVRKRLQPSWTRGWWNGRRRIVFYGESLSSMWLAYGGIIDWDESWFIHRYLRPHDTLVDVGANIGLYSLWASLVIQAGGRIMAFEPDAQAHARLVHHFAINRLSWARAERLAVLDRAGTVRLSSGRDVENQVLADGGAGGVATPAIRLDDYAASHDIDRIHFLKIDVEGAELLTLRGAARLLAARRLDVVQIEFSHKHAEFGYGRAELADFMAGHRYRPFLYGAGSGVVEPLDLGDVAVWPQNVFWTSDLAVVAQRLERAAP